MYVFLSQLHEAIPELPKWRKEHCWQVDEGSDVNTGTSRHTLSHHPTVTKSLFKAATKPSTCRSTYQSATYPERSYRSCPYWRFRDIGVAGIEDLRYTIEERVSRVGYTALAIDSVVDGRWERRTKL